MSANKTGERCAVLCCAVLCCAVLCCAVLCCAVLCCAVPCRVLLYYFYSTLFYVLHSPVSIHFTFLSPHLSLSPSFLPSPLSPFLLHSHLSLILPYSTTPSYSITFHSIPLHPTLSHPIPSLTFLFHLLLHHLIPLHSISCRFLF